MKNLTKTAIVLAALAIVGVPSNVQTKSVPIDGDVLSIYHDLDKMCRGSPGDDTTEACTVRLKVEKLLGRLGYCYGKLDSDDLKKCGKGSLRLKAGYADNPYKEGVRDYYSGLCYRVRPYFDGPKDKADSWDRGYRDAADRDRDRAISHCHPRN
jgi:hypothetical protein